MKTQTQPAVISPTILLLAAAIFFNIQLPFNASTQQAVIVIAALMGAKILLSVTHSPIDRI